MADKADMDADTPQRRGLLDTADSNRNKLNGTLGRSTTKRVTDTEIEEDGQNKVSSD